MFDFSRRFTIADPTFAAAIAAASPIDDRVLATSAAFLTVVKTIRSYSILLSGLKYTEIYNTITHDTDPEIAMLLLSAERLDGSPRYSTEQVESLMWGTPAIVNYADYSQGILEVSCKFAAAVFIGAFATQPFQHTMAEFLRKQAVISLDRLILLQSKTIVPNTDSVGLEKVKEARFYFQPLEITLAKDLAVSFFIPCSVAASSWVSIKTYPAGTTIHTRTIASDIALAINRYTLKPTSSTNIIAAVTQSGEHGYPFIDFAMRDYTVGINCDLVSVQFVDAGGAKELPFKWGIETLDLYQTFINSCLLLQRTPKGTALSTITAAAKAALVPDYNVLYFRNKAGTTLVPVPPPTGSLTYRLSVTSSILKTAASAANATTPRYSQQAIALVNALQSNTTDTRLIGAVVRDDPMTDLAPMAAVELIAWSVLSPTTHLVLDILSVPDDIEIALGDKFGPQTDFSNLPFSLICKPLYEKTLGSSSTALPGAGHAAEVAQLGSKVNQSTYSIREKTQYITGYLYN